MARARNLPYRPTVTTMLWRGLRRRCPWCGGRRAFFTGWFSKQDTCVTCGIDYHRGYEGFELGAATINAIVSMGALVIGLAAGVIATSPDIPVVQMMLILGTAGIVLPIILYPLSYTVWQAVDIAMRPPEPTDPAVPPPRR